MRRLWKMGILIAVLIGSLSAGLVFADHYTGATNMGLLRNKLHYLGQTLSGGATATLAPGPYNISVSITNEDKTWHTIEFECVAGECNIGTEFGPAVIGANGSGSLSVNLTTGTWKVYCQRHAKGNRGMVFYLNVE